MIRWAKDILYDLWVEESGSDQGNELLRSWKVKGNLVWDRVWGPGRGGGSFLRSKRGKEEAAFNRAQKGQDGEQGDKQNRRRSLFEEQKRKRLSERTRGTRVQASKEEEERWRIGKRMQKAAPLISFTKEGARWWLDDKNREQIFLSWSCTMVTFVVVLLVQLTVACKS